MPLISSPAGLSQGASTSVAACTWAGTASNSTVITSTNVPAVTAGDYIEVRDATNSANDGLYVVDVYNAAVSLEVTKVSTVTAITAPVDDAGSVTIRIFGSDSEEKNVFIDTANLRIALLNGFGSVTVLDDFGVVGQDFYSFLKEEWKDDNDLQKFLFPMTSITPEQFEFNFGWKPVDEADGNGITTTDASNTRQLLRTMGWEEVDADGFTERSFFCLLTLGNIDNTDKVTGDQPYYFFASQAAATSTVFAGEANEGVEMVTREDLSGFGTIAFATSSTITCTTGDFTTNFLVDDYVLIQNAEDPANDGFYLITAVVALTLTVTGTPFTTNADDTTALLAVDRRPVAFTARIRIFGKTYDESTTSDIGVTTLVNQVARFPLSEGADAVIVDLADTETAGVIATLLSNITGAATSPYQDIAVGYYASDEDISGFVPVVGDTPSPGDAQFGVVIDADSGGAAGGPPSAEQIYAYTQAFTQLSTNINDPASLLPGTGTDSIVGAEAAVTVIGQLADTLTALASTGNTISTVGQASNPGGAGTGVAIVNFDTNDTNRIAQVDGDGDTRTFPFVAAGTIQFNANLSTDTDAVYRMMFTNDDTGDNAGADFGTIDAITVDDNAAVDIAGAVPQLPGGSSVAWDFDYDGNLQRGTGSDATDAPITIIAIGLGLGQYVVATGTITRAVGQTFSLVAALERNYSAT